MFKKSYKSLIFISVFFFLLSSMIISLPDYAKAQSLNDLMLMTEKYPPFNFEQNGQLQGISVDLMEAMLKRAGSDKTRKDMQLLPWARGYHFLQNEKNACLFATTRTEEREKLFKWVGPISETTIVLTARKDRKLSINSSDDLKKYKIGAVIQDVGEQLLLEAGLSKKEIDSIGGTDAIFKSIKKMNIGRLDAFAYEESVMKWELKQQGFDVNLYETVYVLKAGELYYAFHKDMPEDVIKKMQEALDALKKDGEYQKIRDAYLK
ncbi:MAG: transporter substrate-binding domain-containing protein [Desulfamplus sp.]|nr:transporter substrate-binding domain-containing protein [Desulfamplus sp.]MBF0413791.1 transporter substrate-binding domain-containing protein [Desulfamplus sp.]